MEMEQHKTMSELDKALLYSCRFMFRHFLPSLLKLYLLNQIVPGFTMEASRESFYELYLLRFRDTSSGEIVLNVQVREDSRGVTVESDLPDDIVREILSRIVRVMYTYALFLASNAPPTHDEVADAIEFINVLSRVAPGLCVVEPDILDMLNNFSDRKIMYLSEVCFPVEINQSRYNKLLEDLANTPYIISNPVKGVVGSYNYTVDSWYFSDISVFIENDQAKIRVAFWFRVDKGRPSARVVVTPMYLSPNVNWSFMVHFAYSWKNIVLAVLDHAYSVSTTMNNVRRIIDIARELIRLINDREVIPC